MRTLGKSRSAFRINGGAQNLAEALFERVAGIIPDRFVSLNHELVSIKKNTADYNLEFTTHDGLVEFKAKKIICALPLSVLKNMEGLNQLGLPAEFLQFMNECGQVKSSRITLATQQRDWKDSPFKAHFWSFENKDFFITEGPRDLSQNLAEPMGILQAHLTGVSEKNLGPQTAEDVKKVIQSSISKTISFKEVHLHSWSRSRWSKSAFVFLKPQQITKLPSFEQVHEDWKFCGDYAVSEHIGTMNASVISSNLAAKQMRV
jgi:monoamine oxidase